MAAYMYTVMYDYIANICVCTKVVANYYGSEMKYEAVGNIRWGNEKNSPPPDIPTCGFDGSGCKKLGQSGRI